MENYTPHGVGVCAACMRITQVGIARCCKALLCQPCYDKKHSKPALSPEMTEAVNLSKEAHDWIDVHRDELLAVIEPYKEVLNGMVSNVIANECPPLAIPIFTEALQTMTGLAFALGYHAKGGKAALDIPIPPEFLQAFENDSSNL